MDRSIESLLYGHRFQCLLQKEEEDIMQKYHLHKIDLKIVLYLSKANEKNTSRDIMALGMFTRGHISQSLKRLHKKGFLKLQLDENDHRCVHNYLTEKANGLLNELMEVSQEISEILFDGMSEEERQQFMILAQKVEKNMRIGLMK